MEKPKKPHSEPDSESQSTICKYFGNAFIKNLKEKQLISSQRIYYLSMMMGCGNSQKK
jgi:hypothetical protein